MINLLKMVVLALILVSACSEANDSGGSEDLPTDLLQRPLDCAVGEDLRVLIVKGSVDGETLDIRQTDDQASGGIYQWTTGEFQVPVATSSPNPDLAYTTLNWALSLSVGSTAPTSSGTLLLPTSYARGGATWCVESGMVGFPKDQAADGQFKFSISKLNSRSDCSGTSVTADILGCWNEQ